MAVDLFPAASLKIVQGGTNTSVTINDAGNRPWILESSTDLQNWTPVNKSKVHNGFLQHSFPKAEDEQNLFYRSFFDGTEDHSLGTTENALLLPETLPSYAVQLPPHLSPPRLPPQDNTPADNAITSAGATLGRVLFYDKRLSANQTISCASCHQAEHGFSDPRKFSVGFEGGETGRNSMGLTQARYYPRGSFFWDERAATLEEQVLQPIQNPVEMGMTLTGLVTRLSAEPFYTNLFEKTFGSSQVTTNTISRALAQFVRSMVSTRTKYDLGVAINFSNFTTEENLGRRVFFGQVGDATCVACHGTDNFVPNNVFNNGLENPYIDKGIGALTGRARDEGLFKIPSLRNIELTAPYMHDGRFTNLEEVVEFYNSGVVNHPNLPPPLRVPTPPGTPPGPPLRLNLTTQQKAALVVFLKTLTDTNLVNDPKFSDPFNYGDR